MANRFLFQCDKLIWKLDKVLRVCKRINAKLFYTLAGLVACCTVAAFSGKDSLQQISFLKNDYYDTVVNVFPEFVDLLSSSTGKILFGTISVITFLCFLIRLFYRPFALLIAHSTMGHTLSLSSNFKKEFWFKRVNLTFRLPDTNASESGIIEAIRVQDAAFSKIQNTNWCSKIFYYGVAHTPLIFRLGYYFGQTARVHFLHRFRPNGDEQAFVELPELDNDKLAILNRYTIRAPDTSNRELLVAISTSYSIIKENLSAIDPENKMYRYWVQISEDDNGVDFFNSYHKIRSYAKSFESDIEKFVRNWNIKTVHIVISSSVPFTFYLGQLMKNNQFNKIIVYHYDRTKFTWGIDITESDPGRSIVLLNQS